MFPSLLIPLIISIYSCFSSIDTGLIGQWKGTDVVAQEMGEMEFDQDGYFSFFRHGVKRGGKEFKEGDRLINTFYFTDTEAKPFKIDIVIREKGSDNDQSRILGIYEFVNKDQLKISFNFEAPERPIDFLSAKDIMILDRKTGDKNQPRTREAVLRGFLFAKAPPGLITQLFYRLSGLALFSLQPTAHHETLAQLS